ncbi:hypothetical protein Tco_0662183 [Tanacetum coccineum]
MIRSDQPKVMERIEGKNSVEFLRGLLFVPFSHLHVGFNGAFSSDTLLSDLERFGKELEQFCVLIWLMGCCNGKMITNKDDGGGGYSGGGNGSGKMRMTMGDGGGCVLLLRWKWFLLPEVVAGGRDGGGVVAGGRDGGGSEMVEKLGVSERLMMKLKGRSGTKEKLTVLPSCGRHMVGNEKFFLEKVGKLPLCKRVVMDNYVLFYGVIVAMLNARSLALIPLLVILCYRYQESGIGYWILSVTINGAGNRISYEISTRSDANLRRLVSFDVFRKARGVERLQELQGEGWFECGAKRKLSRCGRNQMGNEPTLALPKGADDYLVYHYDARSKDLETCLEKGREGDCWYVATIEVLMPRVVKSRDEIFSRWGYCDNRGLSRLHNQSIERDRLIGIGFVLDFVEFISFTFGDKEMILVIEAVSR